MAQNRAPTPSSGGARFLARRAYAPAPSTAEGLFGLRGRSLALRTSILVARGGGAAETPGGTDRAPRDITRESRVSAGVGYGGGDFSVAGKDVFFAASDGRLYRSAITHGQPRPLTPAHGGVASPTVSPDQNWLLYVMHWLVF